MPRQTYFAKPGEVEARWFVIDADGRVLGRMATEVATILMGKNKPEYTPHADCGDFVVITNAAKVRLTGNKAQDKVLQRYSGYPGGLKSETYESLLKRRPAHLVEQSIRRMLPKNRLGRKMLKKLKVYAGAEHEHQAQRPQPLEV